MPHVLDVILNYQGRPGRIVWMGCDGKARVYSGGDARDYIPGYIASQTCCPENDIHPAIQPIPVYTRDLRAFAMLFENYWRHFVGRVYPVELMARMALHWRKRYDLPSLAKHLLGEDDPYFEAVNAHRKAASYCEPHWAGVTSGTVEAEEFALKLGRAISTIGLGLRIALDEADNTWAMHCEINNAATYVDMESNAGLRIDPKKIDEFAREYRHMRSMWSTSDTAIAEKIGAATPYANDEAPVTAKWRQWGARTGRSVAYDPPLQSISHEGANLEKYITAPAGYRLIACDYEKAELQMLHTLWWFLRGEYVAPPLYSESFGDVGMSKSELYRIMYGGGTREQLMGFHPNIRRAVDGMWHLVQQSYDNPGDDLAVRAVGHFNINMGPCPSCEIAGTCSRCGMKRVPNFNPGHRLNNVLQASMAGVLRAKLPKIRKLCEETDSMIALIRHDEVVLAVPADLADGLSMELRNIMATHLEPRLPGEMDKCLKILLAVRTSTGRLMSDLRL